MENPNDDQLNEDGQTDEHGSSSESKQDEPPVHDASYYYKQRQEEKAAKAKGTSEIDEETLDTLVNKRVDERLGSMTESLDKTTRTQELKQFLAENPEFQDHKAKIESWWSHPSRKHLPLSSVALEAVGKDGLAKIYGEKALNQEREARQSRIGGGAIRRDASVGTPLTQEKISNMTDQELNAAIKQHS